MRVDQGTLLAGKVTSYFTQEWIVAENRVDEGRRRAVVEDAVAARTTSRCYCQRRVSETKTRGEIVQILAVERVLRVDALAVAWMAVSTATNQSVSGIARNKETR